MVTISEIVDGLRGLGLKSSSAVIVHASLRSFGEVSGGASTVCQALFSTGATLLVPAGSWDLTGIPAPLGLLRPHHAVPMASTWQAFDEALRRAVPMSAGGTSRPCALGHGSRTLSRCAIRGHLARQRTGRKGYHSRRRRPRRLSALCLF